MAPQSLPYCWGFDFPPLLLAPYSTPSFLGFCPWQNFCYPFYSPGPLFRVTKSPALTELRIPYWIWIWAHYPSSIHFERGKLGLTKHLFFFSLSLPSLDPPNLPPQGTIPPHPPKNAFNCPIQDLKTTSRIRSHSFKTLALCCNPFWSQDPW